MCTKYAEIWSREFPCGIAAVEEAIRPRQIAQGGFPQYKRILYYLTHFGHLFYKIPLLAEAQFCCCNYIYAWSIL